MKRLLLILLLAVPCFAQQVNTDILPASTGLNLGHSNQRWNAFVQNLDINGNCLFHGAPCNFGSGGGGNGTLTGNCTPNNFSGWIGTSTLGCAPANFSGINSLFFGTVSTQNDGNHAGGFTAAGNSLPPTTIPSTGMFGIIGFNSSSAASYVLVPNATPPAAGQISSFGTPAPCTGSSVTCIPWNFITPASLSYALQIAGVALTIGDTVNFNNTTPTAPTNGLNVIWAKSTAAGTDSVSAAIVGDGNSAHFLNGIGTYTTPSGGILAPPNPQTGDALQYNVNGSGNWETSQGTSRLSVTAYHTKVSGTSPIYGANTGFGTSNSLSTGGSCVINFPTSTHAASETCTSSASASTSTVIGVNFGVGANFGEYGFGVFYRWGLLFTPGQTTNVRYWMGFTKFDTGGTGGETASVFNTTSFATDTPNRSTIAFRYSASTDTHWVGTAQTTGGSQSTCDTGVTPDTTTAHLFEFTYDGTTANFFIDGALKCPIITNLPATSVIKIMPFWVGDNKNTANAVSATDYWATITLK